MDAEVNRYIIEEIFTWLEAIGKDNLSIAAENS